MQFSFSRPVFELLFSLYGFQHCGQKFEIHESIQFVFLGEACIEACSVLPGSVLNAGRDAYVDGAVGFVGHYVDTGLLFHVGSFN